MCLQTKCERLLNGNEQCSHHPEHSSKQMKPKLIQEDIKSNSNGQNLRSVNLICRWYFLISCGILPFIRLVFIHKQCMLLQDICIHSPIGHGLTVSIGAGELNLCIHDEYNYITVKTMIFPPKYIICHDINISSNKSTCMAFK